MLRTSDWNSATVSAVSRSSSEKPAFSVRIITVDHYQSSPRKPYDVCYSDFRGSEVHKVPVIRIFGITSAGQKACMHVHGVFPYLAIPCDPDMPQSITDCNFRKFSQELALSIDRCINSADRNCNLSPHHVYKIVMMSGRPFYGYHEREQPFLRIYFYNPRDVERVAKLLAEGLILSRVVQPYDAHIPYILQFFIDYNLFGMNFINVSQLQFRLSDEEVSTSLFSSQSSDETLKSSQCSDLSRKVWHMANMKSSKMLSKLKKQTVCELEVDCLADHILNRLDGKLCQGRNPGLLAIWEEERGRRRLKNESSQISPSISQERRDVKETKSELLYKARLMNILNSNSTVLSGDASTLASEGHLNEHDESLQLMTPTSSISNTQDQELLDMVLNMVNSQSYNPDQDSILSTCPQQDAEEEDNSDDETLEMSQLLASDDDDFNLSGLSMGNVTLSGEQPIADILGNYANSRDIIPQFDGAGDEYSDDTKKIKPHQNYAKLPILQSKNQSNAGIASSSKSSNSKMVFTKKSNPCQPFTSTKYCKSPSVCEMEDDVNNDRDFVVKATPERKSFCKANSQPCDTKVSSISIPKDLNRSLSCSAPLASSSLCIKSLSSQCLAYDGPFKKCICTNCCTLSLPLMRMDEASILKYTGFNLSNSKSIPKSVANDSHIRFKYGKLKHLNSNLQKSNTDPSLEDRKFMGLYIPSYIHIADLKKIGLEKLELMRLPISPAIDMLETNTSVSVVDSNEVQEIDANKGEIVSLRSQRKLKKRCCSKSKKSEIVVVDLEPDDTSNRNNNVENSENQAWEISKPILNTSNFKTPSIVVAPQDNSSKPQKSIGSMTSKLRSLRLNKNAPFKSPMLHVISLNEISSGSSQKEKYPITDAEKSSRKFTLDQKKGVHSYPKVSENLGTDKHLERPKQVEKSKHIPSISDERNKPSKLNIVEREDDSFSSVVSKGVHVRKSSAQSLPKRHFTKSDMQPESSGTNQSSSAILISNTASAKVPSNLSSLGDFRPVERLTLRLKRNTCDEWTTDVCSFKSDSTSFTEYSTVLCNSKPLQKKQQVHSSKKTRSKIVIPRCPINKKNAIFKNSFDGRNEFKESSIKSYASESRTSVSKMKSDKSDVCRPCTVNISRLSYSVLKHYKVKNYKRLGCRTPSQEFKHLQSSNLKAMPNKINIKPTKNRNSGVKSLDQQSMPSRSETCSPFPPAISTVTPVQSKKDDTIFSTPAPEHIDVMWRLSYFSPVPENESSSHSLPQCWSPSSSVSNLNSDCYNGYDPFSPAAELERSENFVAVDKIMTTTLERNDSHDISTRDSFDLPLRSVTSEDSSVDFELDRQLWSLMSPMKPSPSSLMSPMKQSPTSAMSPLSVIFHPPQEKQEICKSNSSEQISSVESIKGQNNVQPNDKIEQEVKVEVFKTNEADSQKSSRKVKGEKNPIEQQKEILKTCKSNTDSSVSSLSISETDKQEDVDEGGKCDQILHDVSGNGFKSVCSIFGQTPLSTVCKFKEEQESLNCNTNASDEVGEPQPSVARVPHMEMKSQNTEEENVNEVDNSLSQKKLPESHEPDPFIVSLSSDLSFYTTLDDLDLQDIQLSCPRSSPNHISDVVSPTEVGPYEDISNGTQPFSLCSNEEDEERLKDCPFKNVAYSNSVSPIAMKSKTRDSLLSEHIFDELEEVDSIVNGNEMHVNELDEEVTNNKCTPKNEDILSKIVKSCDLDFPFFESDPNVTFESSDGFNVANNNSKGQIDVGFHPANNNLLSQRSVTVPKVSYHAAANNYVTNNAGNATPLLVDLLTKPSRTKIINNSHSFVNQEHPSSSEIFSPTGIHSFYGNETVYGIHASMELSVPDPMSQILKVSPLKDLSPHSSNALMNGYGNFFPEHLISPYRSLCPPQSNASYVNILGELSSCNPSPTWKAHSSKLLEARGGKKALKNVLHIWEPKLKPPTKHEVIDTAEFFNIPEVVHKEVFYSDPLDFDDREVSNNFVPKAKNGKTCTLPDFVCDLRSQEDVTTPSQLPPLSHPSTSFSLSEEIRKHPTMKLMYSSSESITIMPNYQAPSASTVEKWFCQGNLQNPSSNPLRCGDQKLETVNISKVAPIGNSASIHTPKASSPSKCSGSKVCQLESLNISSQPQFSTPIVSQCNKLIKNGINKNSNIPHSLAVDSSTRHVQIHREFTCEKELTLSPIISSGQHHAHSANSILRKRKLSFEDHTNDSSKVSKILKNGVLMNGKQENMMLFNQSMLNDTNYNSSSEIEGPTFENTGNFRLNLGNAEDSVICHQSQHLTLMSIEVLTKTRNDLRPNPKYDPVSATFFCISVDPGNNQEANEIMGVVAVDLEKSASSNMLSKLKKEICSTPGISTDYVFCTENENKLFEKLEDLVRQFDPDILLGYEIQMQSIGYLLERATVLNMNFIERLSRLVDRKSVKQPKETTSEEGHISFNNIEDLRIPGRIVLDLWRIARKEVTLNVYTFENVFYHVMHQRTPQYSFQVLTEWFHQEPHLSRWRALKYYIIRTRGAIQILEKLDVVGRTSELARVFGIQFFEVLSRGSQFRVESMMLRAAKPLGYIPISPTVAQRSRARAPECIPLVFEPESRFYVDPVLVLDFQSLYPSMIIAYNYCFSTCLGRIEHFGKSSPFEFGCTSLTVTQEILKKLKNDIHISPTGIAFVKDTVRRGVLPMMLEEILNTRIMVKQSMKLCKSNKTLSRILDARQLGLKLIANVTYGYTSANFSGRMPCIEVADSIVGKGRETLERTAQFIENSPQWNAKVVYGDTDSVFVVLKGRSKQQAFKIGQEIADAVTAMNPKPVKLKFEKVYLPCILQTKKRYVGYMYETLEQETPIFDAKGIETVRRDSCPAVAKMLEKSLKLLFESRDVSAVKKYVLKQFTKLLEGRANTMDCIFAKEYRGRAGYRAGACVPALEIARKRSRMDPRSEPRNGERVPYMVVYGFPGSPIIQLVREPWELLQDSSLRINAKYYITRVIIPPLDRALSLLGVDVMSWYKNMSHTQVASLPCIPSMVKPKNTLSQYFVATNCPSCDKTSNAGLCSSCQCDTQTTSVILNSKIRQFERTYHHLLQICNSCTKSVNSNSCISIDCPILFRLNIAERDALHIPHLRNILLHELF